MAGNSCQALSYEIENLEKEFQPCVTQKKNYNKTLNSTHVLT